MRKDLVLVIPDEKESEAYVKSKDFLALQNLGSSAKTMTVNYERSIRFF